MKKFKYLIALILFSCTLVVNAEVVTYERTKENYRVPSDITVSSVNEGKVLNTPSVDESVKVYDFANLLSDSQEQILFNSIIRYTNKTGLEAVIVTIEDNPGKTVKDEAADFYDYNYFKKDGVIFLIDMEVREYAVVTTGNAQNTYTNTEIDIILDNIYPYMAGRNYFSACTTFLNEIDKYFSIQEDDYYYDEDYDVYVKKHSIAARAFNAFLGAVIATVIIILIMVFQCRMVKKASSSRNYLVEETKKIDNLGEIKTGSHTSKIRIQTSSGSGGGSYRSGGGSRSSSFRGSSGRSHGGGSRRF